MTSGWLKFAVVVASAALLAACVGTSVRSVEATHNNVALDRLLIVLRPGSFGSAAGATNVAGSLGNRNLGDLVPHLYARLPLAFSSQGVQARMVSEADLRNIRTQPGERQLWLQADHAVWSSRGGQLLVLVAELIEPSPRKTLWRGEIRMSTPGFGKFDDSVADRVGLQMVEQLQTAHVVVLPGAAPSPAVALAPAPQEPAKVRPQPVVAAPVERPDMLGDVQAVPYLNERGRQGYRDWLGKPTPRAFAVSVNRSIVWSVTP